MLPVTRLGRPEAVEAREWAAAAAAGAAVVECLVRRAGQSGQAAALDSEAAAVPLVLAPCRERAAAVQAAGVEALLLPEAGAVGVQSTVV